jgi:hypothetical protein
MSDVLATAADEYYGYHALNLVGSVKANSDVFERIEVFDLGLTAHQRTLLESVPGVVVRAVPSFSPHWAQCFTWKPWAWMQIDADRVFWLDAGATVLRSLSPALEQVGELGYFLVSQGNELRDIVPADYFEQYALPQRFAERPYVAAGIIGFRPGGEFFRTVLVPTHEDCLAGRNLGFSPDDLAWKNRGLGRMDAPPIRNCLHFRWDQTLLNIHLARTLPDAKVAGIDEYAGVRSPHEHPHQVIWAHRRRGSMRYLKRIPYARGAWRHRVWGAWWQFRWWRKLNERFFERTTYVLKLRALRAQMQARLQGLRRSRPT